MNHAIRKTAALIAVLGAMSLAHAEGGPGDAGDSSTDGAASSSMSNAHAKKAKAPKMAKHKAKAASGVAADGPMSNASTAGKGG